MYKVAPVCAIVLIVGLLLCALEAQAARNFPQDARRGTITEHQYPVYRINKSNLRIAAGGRIYDQHNRIIMPASFYGAAEVMYKLDLNGDLSIIWILTREEALRYKKPVTIQPLDSGTGR